MKIKVIRNKWKIANQKYFQSNLLKYFSKNLLKIKHFSKFCDWKLNSKPLSTTSQQLEPLEYLKMHSIKNLWEKNIKNPILKFYFKVSKFDNFVQ